LKIWRHFITTVKLPAQQNIEVLRNPYNLRLYVIRSTLCNLSALRNPYNTT